MELFAVELEKYKKEKSHFFVHYCIKERFYDVFYRRKSVFCKKSHYTCGMAFFLTQGHVVERESSAP